MKVLFTTPVLEHPAAGGPQLRIENSIKALSRVCDLFIVVRDTKMSIGGDNADVFFRSYCKEMVYLPSFAGLSKNKYIRKAQRVWYKLNQHDLKFILNFIREKGIDAVWCGYGNISFSLIKAIKQNTPNTIIVCDTDSVWSRFILRGLPYQAHPKARSAIEREGKLKELEEKQWVNLCDVTTAVSEVDAEYYRLLAQDPAKIQRFSNVIDVINYPPMSPPAGFRKPCLYLAGTFWCKSPMEQAARWVIQEIMPLLKKHVPDIHLYIVGRGATETLCDMDDPGITITGKIASVLPYLCNADVSLVPLQFESGTRFKILEAGVCSIPVVSTTLGAEGLPVTDGENILIADAPADFANAIVRLLQDKELSLQLGKNLKNLVCAKFSVESLEAEARNILEKVKFH